jgi:hypothetical protein
LLGVLKPAILETDVHLSQLPQSLSEMRLIDTKHPLMPDWRSAMSQNLVSTAGPFLFDDLIAIESSRPVFVR